jgi:hypothetical protein
MLLMNVSDVTSYHRTLRSMLISQSEALIMLHFNIHMVDNATPIVKIK